MINSYKFTEKCDGSGFHHVLFSLGSLNSWSFPWNVDEPRAASPLPWATTVVPGRQRLRHRPRSVLGANLCAVRAAGGSERKPPELPAGGAEVSGATVFFFFGFEVWKGKKLPDKTRVWAEKIWVWIGWTDWLSWYLMGLSDIIGIEWDCFVKNLGDGDGG